VGLYATLWQLLARRSFEVGLRMALGAQSRDVFPLIMRRGFVLALIGLAVGSLPGSLPICSTTCSRLIP
jgi:putative ABC transport system permease protein